MPMATGNQNPQVTAFVTGHPHTSPAIGAPQYVTHQQSSENRQKSQKGSMAVHRCYDHQNVSNSFQCLDSCHAVGADQDHA